MPPSSSLTDTHYPLRGLLRRDRSCPSRKGPLRHDYGATNEEKSAGGCDLDGLLRLAALELAAMRGRPVGEEPERSFPPACRRLLRALLPGNDRCHDCGTPGAGWASVSYGIALCLECSGRHRGLGVGTSFVKSLTLDGWKAREVLCMLEGGNAQLERFFDRHGMGGTAGGATGGGGAGGIARYRTKAASFYRQHLASHARQLAGRDGLYEGREASRKKKTPSTPSFHRETKRRKSIELRAPRVLPSVSVKDPPGPSCVVAGV